MNSTLALSIIGLIVYGVVLGIPVIVNKRISQAKGSLGATLRVGILHLLLRHGALCLSQLSVMLDQPMLVIEEEIAVLLKRGIIKEKEEGSKRLYIEPIYVFGH